MSFDLSGKLTQLINEHGSAKILKERVEAFKDDVLRLEKENLKFKEEIEQIKDENRRLQEQLNEHIKWNSIKFNKRTGTWMDNETQIHYCSSCKSKGLKTPLQEVDTGWRCNVKECGLLYTNPDYQGDDCYPGTGDDRSHLHNIF